MESKQILSTIIELMNELQDKMEPSADDFNSRLGKPKVEAVKITATKPEDGEESEMDDMMSPMDEPESPEDILKARLLKLRSK